MRAAIVKVRQLHRKVCPRGLDICEACTSLDILMQSKEGRGRAGVAYPCATIRVLDAAGV
jgi:hypothetical protein